jgi:hypothetical protein
MALVQVGIAYYLWPNHPRYKYLQAAYQTCPDSHIAFSPCKIHSQPVQNT